MKFSFGIKTKDSLLRFLVGGFVVIIAVMPFHGFLSTWFGSLTGQVELFKAWKELLLAALIVAALIDARRHRKLFQKLLSFTVTRLVLAYAALHVLYVVLTRDELNAVLVALTINLRFLAIFILGMWLALRLKKTVSVQRLLEKVIVISSVVAAGFAVLQALVLPKDFLSSFGYGNSTIKPFFTLDSNDSFIRVAGPARGPNPFAGALVLPITFLGAKLLALQNARTLGLLIVLAAASFFTYSRSGWLALVVAGFIIGLLALPSLWRRRAVVIGVPLALILGFVLVTNAESSPLLSRLVLHDDPNTGRATSTAKHLDAKERAFNQVLDEPLGQGPGTAGPASFYNDEKTRIAENYYLQIGQEVGVVGIALFSSIVVLTGVKLWQKREQMWPRVLFASLVGLSVAAVFGHTWADEEIALVWWGLAGLYLPQT